MSTKADLQVKLDELQRALDAAEMEVDRQKRAAAATADNRGPPQEEAFLAAIAKVDLPSFLGRRSGVVVPAVRVRIPPVQHHDAGREIRSSYR